jgi:hypothetical protein
MERGFAWGERRQSVVEEKGVRVCSRRPGMPVHGSRRACYDARMIARPLSSALVALRTVFASWSSSVRSRGIVVVVVFACAAAPFTAGCASSTGDVPDDDAGEPEPDPAPVGPLAVIDGARDGTAPLLLALDASLSEPGDAALASFAWTVDDEVRGQDLTLDLTLLVAGPHTIALSVTDDDGLSHETSATVTVEPEGCPTFSVPSTRGSLDAADLTELSGLTAARKTPGVYFAHNDSGTGPYLFAISSSGALHDAFEVTGAQAFDWEDIASGPGPVTGENYLYIADTGDNDYVRTSVKIYRVPEPDVDTAAAPTLKSTATAEVITLTYPGARENVEGLVVDPTDGSIYLFTKSYTTLSRIFRAPPVPDGGGTYVLEQVGTLDVNGAGTSTPLITAVDVSPLGNQIAVRTYTHLFVWVRPGGAAFESAFDGVRCTLPAPNEPQGEAVAFSLDARTLVTVSEGAGAPVYQLSRTD